MYSKTNSSDSSDDENMIYDKKEIKACAFMCKGKNEKSSCSS